MEIAVFSRPPRQGRPRRDHRRARQSRHTSHSAVAGADEVRCGGDSDDARHCAELFRKHRDEIDGIIVTLPNFGEERAIVDAIRLLGTAGAGAGAGDARPHRDDEDLASPRQLLRQDVGVQQPEAVRHSLLASQRCIPCRPSPRAFKKDLAWFSAVCRVVDGFSNLRIGAIGARPAAFNTVRYSEKLLERAGISVETLDLSEILGRIDRLKDTDDAMQAKLAAIKKYVSTSGIPEAALLKMSKLGAVIEGWMKETYCTISAIQCWTSLEEYFGVVPCTMMSMMSENLFSSACEMDVVGVLGMHGLRAGLGDAERAAGLEQQLRR